MDSQTKPKDSNSSIEHLPLCIFPNLCNTDTFGIVPTIELVNANSLELNAATSLSDDSGIPLTNSSISSGDSFKMEICKFGIELVESDGEVSQFDSLDSSEGGMSAENFNTLKKVPIAPIDPPPQFQDSPHTTMTRSQALQDYAKTLSKNVLTNVITRWSSQSSFQTKDNNKLPIISIDYDSANSNNFGSVLKDSYNKHIYSSDSILNTHIDNIYDEPNEILSSSVGNSIDIVEPTKSTCPHFQDHTRYFKAIPSEQDSSTTQLQKFNASGLSEIHDYDLYYGLKRNHHHNHHHHHHHYQCDTIQQRKLLYSPLHHHPNTNSGNRPNSRNSLNSRLSSSHNSLSVSNANKADDSIFITQAMSHDALLSREICDFYNVPLDSDIYAFPVDMIKPDAKDTFKKDVSKHHKNRMKYGRNNKRKKRISNLSGQDDSSMNEKFDSKIKLSKFSDEKRHSVAENTKEPLHMTLDEVKQLYHTLYSDTKELPIRNNLINHTHKTTTTTFTHNNIKASNETIGVPPRPKPSTIKSTSIKTITKSVKMSEKNRIASNNNNNNYSTNSAKLSLHTTTEKKSQFSLSLKQKFCSIFRFRKSENNKCRTNSTDSSEYIANRDDHTTNFPRTVDDKRKKFQSRALPPLPKKKAIETPSEEENTQTSSTDIDEKEEKKTELRSFHFTSSIEKVKDYGWYWGPLSSEAAEKVLSNEPDGSFIVRDSSDDHYIFSLSFKLNNCVRHVRIEQDQGTFSFGTYAKFKSQTITEFIEKAVEHSRSGRYLFFLHRRPEHGPMRVQLTNPVSRFKHIQSLQHMCRFVILKAVVRKDLIQTLPLPRRLLDYLNYKHFYSEQVESDSSQSQMSGDGEVS